MTYRGFLPAMRGWGWPPLLAESLGVSRVTQLVWMKRTVVANAQEIVKRSADRFIRAIAKRS
jgi:hypothetical protein